MYASSVELKLNYSDFDDAVNQVKACLMAEKLGVVSEVNVSGVLKAKMDVDIAPYRMLGACMPALAKRVLDADVEGGALLPCNVIVREEGEKVLVTIMDPQAVLGIAHNAELDHVATEAAALLEKVKVRLSAA